MRHSADARQQMLYEIGFLRAQLADAMSNDSQVSGRFRDRVRNILD